MNTFQKNSVTKVKALGLLIKSYLLRLDFKSIVILGLAVALLLTNMCSSAVQTTHPTVKVDGKKYEQVSHKVDTVVVVKDTVIYRPGNAIYKRPLKPTTPPKGVNKDSIVKKYYAVNVYNDTIKLSNNQGYVSVADTISENKIIGRVWNAHTNVQTIRETTVLKELPKNQLYIGGVLGGDKIDPINYVGPAVLFKTKQDHIYVLGVGYGDNGTLSVQAGMFWKIRLSKN